MAFLKTFALTLVNCNNYEGSMIFWDLLIWTVFSALFWCMAHNDQEHFSPSDRNIGHMVPHLTFKSTSSLSCLSSAVCEN